MVAQALTATVNIEIPSTHVLVEIEEYKRLVEQDNFGKIGDIEWLMQQSSCGKSVCYNNLTYFQDELKGIAEKGGKNWYFRKTSMAEWLEQNWDRWIQPKRV